MSYTSGDGYVSKSNFDSGDSTIYGAEFENKTRTINNNAAKFEPVSGISTTQSVERATTAESLTLNYLVSKNGSAYANKVLKTDATSYLVTTIQVRANLSLGANEGSAVTIENTATTFVSDHPHNSKWWWIGAILKMRFPPVFLK